jgi:hypothetical protein
MDDWEHITVHRADNIWTVVGRPDIVGSDDIDRLLAALVDDGWERTEDAHTLTGSDLTRVELRRRLASPE